MAVCRTQLCRVPAILDIIIKVQAWDTDLQRLRLQVTATTGLQCTRPRAMATPVLHLLLRYHLQVQVLRRSHKDIPHKVRHHRPGIHRTVEVCRPRIHHLAGVLRLGILHHPEACRLGIHQRAEARRLGIRHQVGACRLGIRHQVGTCRLGIRYQVEICRLGIRHQMRIRRLGIRLQAVACKLGIRHQVGVDILGIHPLVLLVIHRPTIMGLIPREEGMPLIEPTDMRSCRTHMVMMFGLAI